MVEQKVLIKAMLKAIDGQIVLAKLKAEENEAKEQYYKGVIDALNYVKDMLT